MNQFVRSFEVKRTFVFYASKELDNQILSLLFSADVRIYIVIQFLHPEPGTD